MKQSDYKKSLALHKKHGGKLEIRSKFKLDNKDDLCLAYTPCVAEVSREIAKNKELAKIYTLKKNTVAIVSDGSAVLGLGNIGPEAAIPVMEGKAVLIKKLAGIDGFPICLDTQDPEEIIKTVRMIAPVFGGINLEDISAPKCFYIESQLQDVGIPIFHDDQHGTSIVVTAALINSAKALKRKISDMKIVICGAGASGTAITKMIHATLQPKDIVVCDSQGIISRSRSDLNPVKMKLLEITNKQNISGSLQDALPDADVFIGVSVGGILKPEMITLMNADPIIFAMANPVPEIMPDLAIKAGASIVGTGRGDFPNQINNVLSYPGVFKGLLSSGLTKLTDDIKLTAAKAIADCVNKPNKNKILPSALDKRVPNEIAKSIYAYKKTKHRIDSK
ncbi:MAG: NADP-dependent malic enzyme [Candidatus Paceibacterota bacterium]|jgi:malate dehydrogenase (oxaloacetate-decarboxylating)